MEELQVIETTSGRQFKPWASREDVQAIGQETVQAVVQAVQDPASITAITSEIASGKQAIASAINAKGGSASATESFAQLAEAVETIPNLSDMARLAGIIAGGNYNKNALQGHNENVKYGKTEIVDNVGAFEKLSSYSYMFQYWDLLKKITMPNLTTISGSYMFSFCSSLQEVNMPSLTTINSLGAFNGCSALQFINLPNLVTISNAAMFNECIHLKEAILPNVSTMAGYGNFANCTELQNLVLGKLILINENLNQPKPNLRNITIGQDTDVNLPFQAWTATNVINEGQSSIDELNSNLQINLISKLYQGGGKILRLGTTLYDVTTQETRDMVTAKGWTLQRG